MKRRNMTVRKDFVPADSIRIANSKLDLYLQLPPGESDRSTTMTTSRLKEVLSYMVIDEGGDDIAETRDDIISGIADRSGVSPSIIQQELSADGKFGLDTLNEILASIHDAELLKSRSSYTDLGRLRQDTSFRDAKNKTEAVRRMSLISGGPDWGLGPGSKERKQSLRDLSDSLSLDVDYKLSKPKYAEAMAQQLGVPWDRNCWSTGSSITLEGLNRLLFAQAYAISSKTIFSDGTPLGEANQIARLLEADIKDPWLGQECIAKMKREGSTKWAQSEWQGFYFEHISVPAAIEAGLSEGPMKIGNTEFDLGASNIWDLKTHSVGTSSDKWVILNDLYSIDVCVETFGGVGFIVLEGEPIFDTDGSFKDWHNQLKESTGKKIRKSKNSSNSRRRKKEFVPKDLKFVWIESDEHLAAMRENGSLKEWKQPRQANSAVRAPKYRLNTDLLEASGALLDV